LSDPDPSPDRRPEPVEAIDRRAYVRLAVEMSATCWSAGRRPDIGWPGRVRNISRGGVGLLLRHCFRPGTSLSVELRAGTGAVLRTVTLRVVHATPDDDGGTPCWLLGCAFDQPLSADELDALL
jgi:hypothetical protein